ncbi:MBL fold metallo-hydrolase [Stigmatella aurantiaca]|uniref:Beta-lactamase n=1 Tax=Stigmatella aurantiaca (strain DW4/3-1) TaxID=378806 RepID=Q091X8_STIAD|nr:MBL fold metallo-hydrolase [Stigmatella aurantiaca]ADO71650.1 beta-lactamase [Stigmatella aurantiaca DW4/3-1]EAU66551.1 putative beta lactamase [Stigmatella aurantiaca DW4/3-1]
MRWTMGCWLLGALGLLGCAHTKQEDAPVARYTSDAQGFDTHSFFYDTGSEVVIFDAQFTEAEAGKVLAAVRAETPHPIRYVVVTHPNPDKFNGVAVFQREGAQVVASEATAAAIPAVHAAKKHYWVNVAKAFSEPSYPAQATVDITFRGTYRLPLQGEGQVELTELHHPGVASTQTVAYLPRRQALLVGDLVHYRTHAWLEGALREGRAVPDLDAWKAALEELKAWKGATVYGGRGESAPVEEAVAEQQRYLDGMEGLVKAYVAELGSRKAELCGNDAAPHYEALTRRAAEAFPGYALPYMVQYSVYGLVTPLACGE